MRLMQWGVGVAAIAAWGLAGLACQTAPRAEGAGGRVQTIDCRGEGWPGTIRGGQVAAADGADGLYPETGPIMGEGGDGGALVYVWETTRTLPAEFRVRYAIDCDGDLRDWRSPPGGVFFGNTLASDNLVWRGGRVYRAIEFGPAGRIQLGMRIKPGAGDEDGPTTPALRRLTFTIEGMERAGARVSWLGAR